MEQETQKNLYQDLGVAPDADDQEIRDAWKTSARKNHPDKAGCDAEKFQSAQAAYLILADPEARACYDETGATDQGPKHNFSEAQTVLMGEVQSFLQRDRNPQNMLSDLRNSFTSERSRQKRSLDEVKRKLANLSKQAGRFVHVTNPTEADDNLVEMAIRGSIDLLQRGIDTLQKRVILITEVLELLDGYEDTRPPPRRATRGMNPGMGEFSVSGTGAVSQEMMDDLFAQFAEQSNPFFSDIKS